MVTAVERAVQTARVLLVDRAVVLATMQQHLTQYLGKVSLAVSQLVAIPHRVLAVVVVARLEVTQRVVLVAQVGQERIFLHGSVNLLELLSRVAVAVEVAHSELIILGLAVLAVVVLVGVRLKPHQEQQTLAVAVAVACVMAVATVAVLVAQVSHTFDSVCEVGRHNECTILRPT